MNKNEFGIVRCEHCGKILSAPFDGVDVEDLIEYSNDPGCDYCRDFEDEDFLGDNERNYWL